MFSLSGFLPLGKKFEYWLIDRYLQRNYSIPLKHVMLTSNKWDVAVWDEADVKCIVDEPKGLNNYINKILAECAATDRNTTIRPFDHETKFSLPHFSASLTGLEELPKPKDIQREIDNIIPTNGMRIMAQRGTGQNSSSNTHMAIGDDPTAEDLTDAALGNELDRKDFATYGDRGVPTGSTTEQYGMPWVVGDFPTNPDDAYEAGLFNAASGVTLMAHVTFAQKTISSGRVLTTQINISHQNGTQV